MVEAEIPAGHAHASAARMADHDDEARSVKVLAVTHLKGGVGKTTLAVNIACSLASKMERRHSVILIDGDINAVAARWLDGNHTVAVERLPFGATELKEPWTKRVFDRAAGCDWCVIDLPANIVAANSAALMIAHLAVIPVTASGLDLSVSEQQLNLVRDARIQRQETLPQILLVPSRIDRRTAIGRELEDELRELTEPVGPAISSRVQLVDAFTSKQWIGEFAPRSVAHQQIEALVSVIRRSATTWRDASR
jgi:chromosome partitioning protein